MTAIIVVDDQASNRRIMTKLAASVDDNVEVVAFGNPLQALEYIEGHTPDLLITDFKMQPIDGDEFIRRFRSVPACANVPAVVVTSHQDVEFRRRALAAGSTDFLLSPLNYQDFRARSRSLLAQSRHLDIVVDLPEARSAALAEIEMLNEMLLTVNDHLATTLTDLEFARGDLSRLIEATQVAAVFVDSAMLVRNFTPAVTSLFKLKQSDIGRPLTAIASDLALSDLAADFEQARETGEHVKKYVHSHDGQAHYLMTMLPYRGQDGRINGTIMTFTRVGVWYSGQG